MKQIYALVHALAFLTLDKLPSYSFSTKKYQYYLSLLTEVIFEQESACYMVLSE